MKAVKALLSVAAGLIAGGLALAGPASAQLDAQLDAPMLAAQIDDDPPEGATYSLTGCEASIGWQSSVDWTTWIVIDADGTLEVVEIPAGDTATSSVYNLTELEQDLRVRLFGGPERDSDSPLWDTEGYPDWADTVAELEAAEGRPWQASDDAPFVTWHVLATPEECQPEPEPTPSATATPTEPPADEDGAGGELPETSGLTIAAGAGILGASLVGAGGLAVLLARRRRVR